MPTHVCARTGGYTCSRKEKENESNYGRGPDAMCGAAVFDEMERKYWPAIRGLTVSLILVQFLFLVLPPPLPRETRPYEFGYVRFTCQKLINPPPPLRPEALFHFDNGFATICIHDIIYIYIYLFFCHTHKKKKWYVIKSRNRSEPLLCPSNNVVQHNVVETYAL